MKGSLNLRAKISEALGRVQLFSIFDLAFQTTTNNITEFLKKNERNRLLGIIARPQQKQDPIAELTRHISQLELLQLDLVLQSSSNSFLGVP